jgi:hypothetical protein
MRLRYGLLLVMIVSTAAAARGGPDEDDIVVNPTGGTGATVRITHDAVNAGQQGSTGVIWGTFVQEKYAMCRGTTELSHVTYFSAQGKEIAFRQVGPAQGPPRIEVRVDGSVIGDDANEQCFFDKEPKCQGAGFPGELWGRVRMFRREADGDLITSLRSITFKWYPGSGPRCY